MVIRKNIALEEKHLKAIEPLLKKNDNNLSAAIRDAIDFAEQGIKHFGTLDKALIHLSTKQTKLSALEESIQAGKNLVINLPTFLWFLKYTRGLFMEREILEETLDPLKISTISELDTVINNICRNFGWQMKVSLFSMDNVNPESVTMVVSGGTEVAREFVALHIAQFFAFNRDLDVDIVHKRASSMRIDFKKTKDKELPGLNKFFGYNHTMMNEIIRKQEFWKIMVLIHLSTNYNIVSIYRNNFENILSGKPLKDPSVIESYVKKHISDIPYKELIFTLKLLHENMGIVKRIEYSGNDTIKIYHEYKDMDAVYHLTEFYKYLLKSGGQHFDAKYSTSLIILERIKA